MDTEEKSSPFKTPGGNGLEQSDPTAIQCKSSEQPLNSSDGMKIEPRAGVPTSSIGDNQQWVNPFEKDALEGLQNSFWSPSVMEIKDTPPQQSWAIEQMSTLFPKDIESSPTTHQNAFPVDEQTEAKAQADITKFFKRSQIAPTPSPVKTEEWAQPMQSVEFTKMRTSANAQRASQSERGDGGNSGLTTDAGLEKKKATSAVGTQTKFGQWPPHIQALLSKYILPEDFELSGSFVDLDLAPQRQQKSEISKSEVKDAKNPGNDSGNKSSSPNDSTRNRLELSFGDDPDGETSRDLDSPCVSPIIDPFRRSHLMITPPASPGSEMEVQLMRCELTPETTGLKNVAATPGLTPITDEPERKRSENLNSTPKRGKGNATPKRVPKRGNDNSTPPSKLFREDSDDETKTTG